MLTSISPIDNFAWCGIDGIAQVVKATMLVIKTMYFSLYVRKLFIRKSFQWNLFEYNLMPEKLHIQIFSGIIAI